MYVSVPYMCLVPQTGALDLLEWSLQTVVNHVAARN